MYEYTNTKKEGFTVVELLVAMGVFTALLSFAVGVFVQGMRSQRELTDQIAVNNEMSLVLEQMAREMRTGSFSHIESSPSPLSVNTLTFEGEDEGDVTYALAEEVLDGASYRYISRNGMPFTGKDVSVEGLTFFVSHETTCSPWRSTILVKVRPRFSSRSAIPIQTTISSRVLPVDLEIDENNDGVDDFAECERYLIEE